MPIIWLLLATKSSALEFQDASFGLIVGWEFWGDFLVCLVGLFWWFFHLSKEMEMYKIQLSKSEY